MFILLEKLGEFIVRMDETVERLPDSELALAFGRSVRARLCLRISLETIARAAGVRPSDCVAAVRFAEGPDLFKFRAMAEDWSWDEIKKQVRLQRTGSVSSDSPPVVVFDSDFAAKTLMPRGTKPLAEGYLLRPSRFEGRSEDLP